MLLLQTELNSCPHNISCTPTAFWRAPLWHSNADFQIAGLFLKLQRLREQSYSKIGWGEQVRSSRYTSKLGGSQCCQSVLGLLLQPWLNWRYTIASPPSRLSWDLAGSTKQILNQHKPWKWGALGLWQGQAQKVRTLLGSLACSVASCDLTNCHKLSLRQWCNSNIIFKASTGSVSSSPTAEAAFNVL